MVNDWRVLPALVLFLTLALSTRHTTLYWHNNLTFWTYAVTTAPEKIRPITNLAAQLILEGRLDEAKIALNRTLELAARPSTPQWARDEAEYITYINSATVDRIIARNRTHP